MSKRFHSNGFLLFGFCCSDSLTLCPYQTMLNFIQFLPYLRLPMKQNLQFLVPMINFPHLK